MITFYHMKKIKGIKIWVFILFTLGIISLGLYIYAWEYRKPLLEVDFFSLNKGRAIFVRTPMNKTILIGGGQNSETIREITKQMPFYSKKIDTVIIPSATAAQIGGLIEIVDRYEIEEILIPKMLSTSTVLTQLMKEVRKNKIHVEEVERGDTIEIENDLSFEILFPYEEFKFNKTSLPELGLAILYKDTGVYLMGNLSKTIQKDIAQNLSVTTKNILEYYHSATDTKVSPDLVEKLDPKFTFSTKEKSMRWISDGLGWERGE